MKNTMLCTKQIFYIPLGPLTKKGESPSLDTDEQERWTVGKAHMLKVYKNRPKHALTSWHGWGSPGLQALSFPSFPYPELLRLRYLNMSAASVLAGAHQFVASNNTFNTANTVSRMVIM